MTIHAYPRSLMRHRLPGSLTLLLLAATTYGGAMLAVLLVRLLLYGANPLRMFFIVGVTFLASLACLAFNLARRRDL